MSSAWPLFGSCCVTKKIELLDSELKALDPRKWLKRDGCTEKVKMKTKLEHLRTILIYLIKPNITNGRTTTGTTVVRQAPLFLFFLA